MIGGSNPIAGALGRFFDAQSRAAAAPNARSATGKNTQGPSASSAGSFRASALRADVQHYSAIKAQLLEAQGLVDYARQAASSITLDLQRLKELAGLHAASSGDSDAMARYEQEFTALKASIDVTLENTRYDGVRVISANDEPPLLTITLDPEGSALFSVEFSASDIITTDALSVTDEASVDNQLAVMASFSFKAESYGSGIERHIDGVEVIINSKEATASMITDADEVRELSKLTDLQIRQQADLAMLSQANVTRTAAARLYDAAQ